jgi:gluconolactonase
MDNIMEALATGYGLIEGPLWDDQRGLIFSDVINGGIHALDATGNITTIVPKRRGVGGIAAHRDGGLILGGRDVIAQPEGGSPAQIVVPNDITDVSIGFNDLTTDSTGRVWVGSLGFRVFAGEPMRPGHLHRVDLDGTVHTVSDDVTLTNGLGFSPDGTTLYHSDSRRQTVRAYSVCADGSLSAWRPFATFTKGIPDGLAIAADGSVWVANAEGGCVTVYEPDGTQRAEIPVPMPMVTSVSFGGAELEDLYIVTGSRDGPHKNCGTIYRMRAPVAGLPLQAAAIAL